MKIKVNGKEYSDLNGTLEDLKIACKNEAAICATVNGRLRELTYPLSQIKEDSAEVVFLDLTYGSATSIYQASLRYVVAMAVKRIYPKIKLRFNYSISRSILAVLEGIDLDEQVLSDIVSEVKKIIASDYKIKRKTISLDTAIDMYREAGMDDKVEILKYREEKTVNLYTCEEYFNYMFGYMVPSTGYLKEYNIFSYAPGFLIQYPRAEENGKIPEFVDAPIFGQTLKDAHKWGKITGGNSIPRMNAFAENRELIVDFVNMCETKHNDMLCKLGETIYQNKDDIRLIAVAGPSSSGKTTFTNRLRIELLSRGLHPIMISIDDYYLGRDVAPKDKDGNPDLEHIEALDIDLFNRDMLALTQGKEITLPKFNFHTGLREKGKTVKATSETPIMIEGIHALNDRLTSRIPKHQKFKIYIAPQTQLHIDNHNPISITDLRLLRRIVRDQKYRNSSAISTMQMWSSVRRGEFKWIYPYQEDADFVFNSELSYELGVLKKYALPQLQAIDKNSPYFISANKLVKFLKYFVDVDDDIIPSNSLLREFIGGSSFAG